MNRTLILISQVFFLICLFSTGIAFAGIDLFKKADTAKKCSICHYRWLEPFYVEHKETPLAPLEEEKVVATRQMCLSCHDGSVRDSRDKVCNDPGHRVGAIPSANITIPERFPLDKKGGLKCATCHTPHATPGSGGAMVEFFLRAPNINSSFCKMCHTSKTGGTNRGNHPVDILPQTNTPAIVKAGGRFGTAPENHIICETCHIPHGGVNNRFLVLSAEDPKTQSVLCEVCHTKNPGMDGDLYLNSFSHPLDLSPDFMVKIPEKWKSGRKIVMGTGGELLCRTCHVPHGAVEKKALLSESNHMDSLCIQCHREQSGISASSHSPNNIFPDEKNINGQMVSALGPCSPCHLIHQGTGKLMWARKTQIEPQKPGEVCFACHYNGGIAEKVIPVNFFHPMDITLSGEMKSPSIPLFDQEGKNNINGKIRCSTCHDFHSPTPFFSDKGKEQSRHAKFLRLSEKGAGGICIECHSRHGLIEGTAHDLRVMAPDFTNSSGQTPFQGGVCSPCHTVHGPGRQKYLWAVPLGDSHLKGWDKTYTTDSNMIVMMCTGCHSHGKIADKHVPKFGHHPREKMAEGVPGLSFEQVKDSFPIFTDKGEIDKSGNIVCSTCHNPHQWDPNVEEKGSGKRFEGDAGNSFLRPELQFKFCTGCHDKDVLIKFTYFHKKLSRLKKEFY